MLDFVAQESLKELLHDDVISLVVKIWGEAEQAKK